MRLSTSLPLALSVALMLSAPGLALGEEAGWKTLFNGKDLSGWEAIGGPASQWKVHDGVLSCGGGGAGEKHAWLSSADQYKNFELELEFRLPPGGNSGVFLRAPHDGNPSFEGMEIQVLDDPAPEYANIKPFQHCGSLYGLAAAKPGALKPAGEWQKYLILCDGQHVKVTLNGMVVVDANLADYQNEPGHAGVKRTEGYVGFQNHSTPIDYRNIRIRVLP